MNKQQELLATLQNLLSSASEDYYIDYYLSDFKPAKGINLSDRNKIINNTIKKYKEHHKDFQDKKMKLILEELHEIIKQDIVIYFEDILIYTLKKAHHPWVPLVLEHRLLHFVVLFRNLQQEL